MRHSSPISVSLFFIGSDDKVVIGGTGVWDWIWMEVFCLPFVLNRSLGPARTCFGFFDLLFLVYVLSPSSIQPFPRHEMPCFQKTWYTPSNHHWIGEKLFFGIIHHYNYLS